MDSKSKKKVGAAKKGLDFYEILELPERESATAQQIKTQYKRLALKWHPDKNNNSEESNDKFKLIAEAYSILSNPERRKHYDKYGTVADDEEGEAAFFREFEEMFFGGGFGASGDFDEFTEFLESDTKFMRKMRRDMGKNARVRGKRRKGGAVGGGASSGGIHMNIGGDMEDMLNFFMMPGMMGMGMGGGKKNKKKGKKKEKEEGDGWETEEDELDEEDGVKKESKSKEDDGWETLSD